MSVTAGQLKNQTVLPLPPLGDADLSTVTGSLGKDMLLLMEAALMGWTRQIKAVLQIETEVSAEDKASSVIGPLVELDYWANRAMQLSSICEQLAVPRMHQIIEALGNASCSYLPAFERLCCELDAACHVATECNTYLQPLRKLLDKLHSLDDFSTIVKLYRPILHTLMLIWQHSKHYCSAQRLVTLVRQICSELVYQARKFCPGRRLCT